MSVPEYTDRLPTQLLDKHAPAADLGGSRDLSNDNLRLQSVV
jgi:hypothetical protein